MRKTLDPIDEQVKARDSGDLRPSALAALERRKRHDAAAALPFAALTLFASPLLDLAAGGGSVAGVPLGVLYIFGGWFGLIFLTARLARRLVEDGKS